VTGWLSSGTELVKQCQELAQSMQQREQQQLRQQQHSDDPDVARYASEPLASNLS